MKLLTKLLYLSLFISFLSCNNTAPESIDEYVLQLEEMMEDDHIPALASLIFNGSDILHESYLGQSSIEQDIALQNNHLFLMASVSKTITGTALMQLVENGTIDLDDPINDYLTYEVKIPGYSKKITFRMLMTHSSGIADGDALDGQYYYGEDSPIDLEDYLESYLSTSGNLYDEAQNFHNFEPGTQFEYSNTGSALIGALVQKITNQNFVEYCQENIFTPLAMTNTAWRLDQISQTIVQPYEYNNGNEKIEHYTFTDYPNGGLRSTPRDMHKFAQGFLSSSSILSTASTEQITTSQIPSLDNTMGLQMFLMDEDNSLWGHDGGEQGTSTIMVFNKETKVGAIILCNQSDIELDQLAVQAYQLGLSL